METSLHFTIAVPHYQPASNGVMTVYQLSNLLIALGHQITLLPHNLQLFENGKDVYPKHLLERFEIDPSRATTDSIAIFPETTPEDIIRQTPAKRRVWYLLNKPYVLTGRPLPYRSDDLVVAYSGLISKAYYNLFLTREINELSSGRNSLKNPPKKERLILLYFGKSRTTKVSDEIKTLIKKHKAKVVVINRIFPKSRDNLFDLLRKARLLISYDPLTNLNYEATLCGTPCYIVDNYMQLKFEDYNIPLHGFFQDAQLLEESYLNGIEPRLLEDIHDNYLAAQQHSMRSVQGFLQLCRDWFSFVADADLDPLKTQFLARHNSLRLQMDRIVFELTGSTHITEKLHAHSTTEFLSPAERICRRIERLKFNLRRNWYKHFLNIRGECLDRKLSEMRAECESRSLDIKW